MKLKIINVRSGFKLFVLNKYLSSKYEKYRLPRKTKKALRHKLWLYPKDDKVGYLMAFPARSQQDYSALKKGIVRQSPRMTKAERKQYYEVFDKEIFVEDQVLKEYVNKIFAKEFWFSTYLILLEAKNNL